jgi:hypothetical protein
MPAFRDLTGQKFGRWTVLRRAENKGHLTAWHVQCVCGIEKIVTGGTLVEGTSRSCGCRRTPVLAMQRFGRLTVMERIKNNNCGRTRWLCVCDCGSATAVIGKSLITGNTKSCGCLKLQVLGDHATRHGHARGRKPSPEYRTYSNMLMRCRLAYKNYGGRGIAVCDRWRFGESGKSGFACFLADMGPKPSPKHQLDRIDNDGNYELANCRWATRFEQQNNKRTNHFITIRNRTMSIADWARELDFPDKELRALVDYGEKLLAKTERTATALTAAASARRSTTT